VLELDHVFVAARLGAPELEPLVRAGFQEGRRNRHPGQGTASAGVFFENLYLEFLWLEERADAESAPIRRTGLAHRADPEHDALPFGFGLRYAAGAAVPLPFATWDYRPPYLPTGVAMPMGANSGNLKEPLLFVLPWKSGPGHDCPMHPNGARRVTKVLLTMPAAADPSAELSAFIALGLVSVEGGPAPLLEVELDGCTSGTVLDMRTAMPLIVRW